MARGAYAIYEEVVDKGRNPRRRAFVESYGSANLDAANLLIPLVKFMGPTDPRMLSTLDESLRVLVSNSPIYRYLPGGEDVDGLAGRPSYIWH
jgi:GH15 family glucan-1,4-alpha-glucosidase